MGIKELESNMKNVALTTAKNQENQLHTAGDHHEKIGKGAGILSYVYVYRKLTVVVNGRNII